MKAVALMIALAVAMGARVAPAAAAPAADACPGSHLKPSCHLDERAVCHCTRHNNSSLTICSYVCEPKP
jgi:hypothetical protein